MAPPVRGSLYLKKSNGQTVDADAKPIIMDCLAVPQQGTISFTPLSATRRRLVTVYFYLIHLHLTGCEMAQGQFGHARPVPL
jgi:hypothetical protein